MRRTNYPGITSFESSHIFLALETANIVAECWRQHAIKQDAEFEGMNVRQIVDRILNSFLVERENTEVRIQYLEEKVANGLASS